MPAYIASSDKYIPNPYTFRKDSNIYIEPTYTYGSTVPNYYYYGDKNLNDILGDGSRVVLTENLPIGDNSEGNAALRKYIVDYISARTNNKWWNSLDDTDKIALLERYKSDEIKNFENNFWGMALGEDYTYDTSSIIKDLEELNSLGEYPASSYPVLGDYVQSSDDIYSQIDAELNPYYTNARSRLQSSYNAQTSAIDKALAELTAETDSMRDLYTSQLQENADIYNQRAQQLLSNQYLANAQTYDALQSDMRKSRQNALEAGASAGLRLASNVNTLLSAQNKQSQISMDTSNSLAEMLLQQRQAASGIRSDYSNYMQGVGEKRARYGADRANAFSSYNSGLTSLDANQRSERQSMYSNMYNTQNNNYNRAVQGYKDTTRSYEDKASTIEGTNAFAGPYTTWAKYK
jgi:hypothetical protein